MTSSSWGPPASQDWLHVATDSSSDMLSWHNICQDGSWCNTWILWSVLGKRRRLHHGKLEGMDTCGDMCQLYIYIYRERERENSLRSEPFWSGAVPRHLGLQQVRVTWESARSGRGHWSGATRKSLQLESASGKRRCEDTEERVFAVVGCLSRCHTLPQKNRWPILLVIRSSCGSSTFAWCWPRQSTKVKDSGCFLPHLAHNTRGGGRRSGGGGVDGRPLGEACASPPSWCSSLQLLIPVAITVPHYKDNKERHLERGGPGFALRSFRICVAPWFVAGRSAGLCSHCSCRLASSWWAVFNGESFSDTGVITGHSQKISSRVSVHREADHVQKHPQEDTHKLVTVARETSTHHNSLCEGLGFKVLNLSSPASHDMRRHYIHWH